MTREIFERVCAIVAEQYREDASIITPATRFVDDLGDSYELVTVVMECEEAYTIEIPDTDAAKLETVGMLVAYIEQRLQPQPGVWPPPV